MIRPSDSFMDTPTLVMLNERAIERGYNRAISDELIEMLDPKGFHVISMIMFAESGITRAVRIHFKVKDTMEPVIGPALDMYHEDYDALLTYKDYGPYIESCKDCPNCGFSKPFQVGDYMCWDCRSKDAKA